MFGNVWKNRKMKSYIFTSGRQNCSILTWKSDSSCQNLYIDSWKLLDSGITRISQAFLSDFDLNDRFASFPAGYREDFSRRIRISGRKCLKNASRYRKLGKTNLRKIEKIYFLTWFSYFSFFLKPDHRVTFVIARHHQAHSIWN